MLPQPLLDLLTQLETVLVDELGTQPNGSPAIFTEINGRKANTSGINGLACIVQSSTKTNQIRSSSRQEKFVDEYWDLTLVQFDRTKSTQNAKRLIQKYFQVMPGGVDETEGTEKTYEMCRIKIWVRGFI